ncbi:MAG: triose-phosphate isomerase [Pseudomonadales bacterium]
MRRPLVAGNWKMNGSRESLQQLTADIIDLLNVSPVKSTDLLLLPPYVYIDSIVAAVGSADLAVGAQDVDARHEGAVTGAVAATMLKDVGCTHVLAGHSERRQLFGEDDSQVALKCAMALKAQLTPIVCVGESLQERKDSKALEVVTRQLNAVISLVSAEGIASGLIAYEPVWAIGTGETASPAQAQEVHQALRQALAAHDQKVADATRIVYGGSVKPQNAEALFAEADIDGALVGGAAMDAASFLAICQAADKSVGS